ncbi:hypothetical protein BDV98DRAFT_416891 [Pterulicium gracile]|uniref:Uncharacterized protein n=1 Tax=Pterulicium gracile TaxID=1884261 RepID=A0A5C3QXN3_9AGAR|nr:hypothetical protein BDV98DRAFT_416891 [Pterula gracilis]
MKRTIYILSVSSQFPHSCLVALGGSDVNTHRARPDSGRSDDPQQSYANLQAAFSRLPGFVNCVVRFMFERSAEIERIKKHLTQCHCAMTNEVLRHLHDGFELMSLAMGANKSVYR